MDGILKGYKNETDHIPYIKDIYIKYQPQKRDITFQKAMIS